MALNSKDITKFNRANYVLHSSDASKKMKYSSERAGKANLFTFRSKSVRDLQKVQNPFLNQNLGTLFFNFYALDLCIRCSVEFESKRGKKQKKDLDRKPKNRTLGMISPTARIHLGPSGRSRQVTFSPAKKVTVASDPRSNKILDGVARTLLRAREPEEN